MIALVLACAMPRLVWPTDEEPATDEGPPPGEAQITFTADRANLSPGECATLQWNVQGGFGVTLNGQPVEKSGQQQVCPGETTSYRLGVDTGKAIEERVVTIVVEGAGQPQPPTPGGPQPPTVTSGPPQTGCPGPPTFSAPFTANPSTIIAGQSSTLSWGNITNGVNGPLVQSAVITPGLGEVGSGASSRVVKPTTTTTYTLTATGCGGTVTRQVIVTVLTVTPTNTPITAHVISADLKITDLFPKSLPVGRVYTRITNGGPDDLTNAQVGLACVKSLVGQHRAPPSPTMITISVKAHQTIEYDTGIDIDTSAGAYTVTCAITFMFDPNSSNNTYSENIP